MGSPLIFVSIHILCFLSLFFEWKSKVVGGAKVGDTM